MVRLLHFVPALAVVFSAGCLATARRTPTPTRTKRNNDGFVRVENGQFVLNGKPFRFLGTNAYYLAALNSDKDINDTIHDIASHGITVIRTWAFNDVTAVPVNGTWFQLIQNGTTSVNEGPNGLQKLDKVVKFAEEAGVKILFSLTNNWNPLPLLDNSTDSALIRKRRDVPLTRRMLLRRDVTFGTNNTLPRNFLSNDYGGMDAYVREFGLQKEHGEFYSNQTIIDIFKNYTTQIVRRFSNSSTILAWELANDARCNSTLLNSPLCDTLTVTDWHDNVGTHVSEQDPNHVVASGVQGFICMDCEKRHPLVAPPPPPPPAISPAPGVRKKKSAIPQPLTKGKLIRDFLERTKKTGAAKKKRTRGARGMQIRGRWSTTKEARQSPLLGVAFDGSSGVDAQDILNSPNIGFGTFQLFPDQNSYGPTDENLSPFENAVNQGLQWIAMQASLAQEVGKPVIMSAFGIVTQNNSASFVPFNQSLTPAVEQTVPNAGVGVVPINATDAQQADAYTRWITAANDNGLSGAIQFQWGQGNLTTQVGTTISPNEDTSGVSPNEDTSGVSPNDGYRSAPTGSDGISGVLSSLAALFNGVA